MHADVIRDGCSALGFGVGSEPPVAAFAAAGSTVLATDQSPETAVAWADTGQHAARVVAVQRPHVCAPDVLAERVMFRAVDMTSLPADLGVFDLVWSSCCFEHFGSPEAGSDFVMAAMQHVRPGGVAVHTTEYDTTRWRRCRETGSVAAGDYVAFYRGRDPRRLVRRLRDAGHIVNPFWGSVVAIRWSAVLAYSLTTMAHKCVSTWQGAASRHLGCSSPAVIREPVE